MMGFKVEMRCRKEGDRMRCKMDIRSRSINEPGLMGSRREICPATPSSKPCLAKTRKATARCCNLYLRSSSLFVNVGGDRIFTLPSLSPRKCTSSKNWVG